MGVLLNNSHKSLNSSYLLFQIMEWNEWIGKEKVFIKLRDGSVFSNCKIIDSNENFLHLIDKFGAKVTIATSEIIKIVEEGGEEK